MKSLQIFSRNELRIFHICLGIILEAEYIDLDELETRTGVSAESINKLRTTIASLTKEPVHNTEFSYEEIVTIYCALNEVLNGIIMNDDTLESSYKITRYEVEEVMKRIKSELGRVDIC